MNKLEDKVGDFCPKCKNCKCINWEYDGKNAVVKMTSVTCEDPYDGMVMTLDVDSGICCSKFEMKQDMTCNKISLLQHELEMDRLRKEVHQLEKEKVAHMKGIERLKKSQEKLQNQVKNLQTTNEESYKREEKLEDKVHKLERMLHGEKERGRSIDTNLLMPLTRVLYPGEKVCKPYSEVLEDIKLLNKRIYDLKEDNKRLADKNKALEEKLKKANDLADSWQRDYEFVRDRLIHPIYDILYPGNLSRDINVTDLLDDIKNLKVYSNENKSMYEDLEYWKERCHKAETDVTTLNSKVEVLENKLRKVDSIRDAVWNEKELKQKISDLTEANENLTKAVERRDRWVEELKSDVDTLQNEILRIRNIAQKAYDDTNRD